MKAVPIALTIEIGFFKVPADNCAAIASNASASFVASAFRVGEFTVFASARTADGKLSNSPTGNPSGVGAGLGGFGTTGPGVGTIGVGVGTTGPGVGTTGVGEGAGGGGLGQGGLPGIVTVNSATSIPSSLATNPVTV